jgi:transcriptional regulator with XRE-family HTH domain
MDGLEEDTISARMVYAEELARQRKERGWTLQELANLCTYDPSYLYRLETGKRLGSKDAAQALDRVYGTGRLLARLWKLAKEEANRSRYDGFVKLEARATKIQEYSVSTVPGLLQTKGYAEALLRTETLSPEQLAQGVAARVNRQGVLLREKPVNYRVLLDEMVLQRVPLEPGVWAEQLERLIEDAQRPNVSIQVVPLKVGVHSLLRTTLQLLRLSSGEAVAYVETDWSGQLIEEIEDVEQLGLFYDQLRDSALSPPESLEFLRTALEDYTSCLIPSQS